MQIKFNPQRSDKALNLEKQGDILTINGDPFDFSPVPEGATLPAEAVDCEFIIGPVERVDGELCLTLLLPHGANPSQAQAFPEPVTAPEDGPIPLPQPEPEQEPASE